MKKLFLGLAMIVGLAAILTNGTEAADTSNNARSTFMQEQLNLTHVWDKTFPQSDKVTHSKITFHTVTASRWRLICMSRKM
jgi:hypothetical protein